MTDELEQEFIRPIPACHKFGITPSTLYRWINAGHLTAHKRGGITLINLTELRAYVTGKGKPK